jgi:hypothetical protein
MAACSPTLSGKHWSAHQHPINHQFNIPYGQCRQAVRHKALVQTFNDTSRTSFTGIGADASRAFIPRAAWPALMPPCCCTAAFAVIFSFLIF